MLPGYPYDSAVGDSRADCVFGGLRGRELLRSKSRRAAAAVVLPIRRQKKKDAAARAAYEEMMNSTKK